MADRTRRAPRKSETSAKDSDETKRKQKMVVAAGIGAMILTTLAFILS